MKKPLPASRQPTVVNDTKRRIKKVVFAFDRITFWVDGNEKPKFGERIREHVKAIEVKSNQSPYQSTWTWEIKVLQPSVMALRMLKNKFGSTRRTKLVYLELACDLITRNSNSALILRDFILSHAMPKYLRNDVLFYESTAYYNRLHSGNDSQDHVDSTDDDDAEQKFKKSSTNLVIYADRPSKQNGLQTGKPCCHIEWRLHGHQGLKRAGVSILDDLVHFDHFQFWSKNLILAQLPKKVELGQFFEGKSTDVDDAAYRKRARTVLRRFEIGGVFLLHNFIRANKDVKKFVLPIDLKSIFSA